MSALHLSLEQAASLFGIMLVAALIPGVSVMTVAARTLQGGLKHGVAATLGIVAGDALYILLAVYGLAILASALGEQFAIVKLLVGIWLLWLGAGLLKAAPASLARDRANDLSLRGSFMLGLLITLGDQKAVLFYMGLLPALVDASQLSALDAIAILLLAVIALSSKLVYAVVLARSDILLSQPGSLRLINIAAGCILLATGVYLLYASLRYFLSPH